MLATIAEPQHWVDRYGAYLLGYAQSKTGEQAVAEDLVQDTFYVALGAADAFRGESSERTWLTSILRHKIIDHFRKAASSPKLAHYLEATDESFHRDHFEDGGQQDGHWLSGAVSPAPTPSEVWEGKEMQRGLQGCVQRLPPRLAPVFAARYLLDGKMEEICKEFEISSSNYWVIIHRSKVLLLSCLQRGGYLSHSAL